MSQAVSILMPSGMQSKPHVCKDADETLKLAESFTTQMRSWHDFEAWLVISEDEKEISQEHIRT